MGEITLATLGEKFAALERTVESESRILGEKIEKLDERLFGNGQPGVIKELEHAQRKMESQIHSLKSVTDHVQELHSQNLKRFDKLEETTNRIEKTVNDKLSLLRLRNLILMGLLYLVIGALTGNGIATLSNLLKLLGKF